MILQLVQAISNCASVDPSWRPNDIDIGFYSAANLLNVVSDDKQNSIVFWQGKMPDDVGCALAAYLKNGIFHSLTKIVEDDETISSFKAVMDGTGKAVAVWLRGNAIESNYFNGAAWSGVIPLLHNQPVRSVDVAVNKLGQFYAGFLVQEGGVLGSYFETNAWMQPEPISTQAYTSASNIQVKINAHGNKVACWKNNRTIVYTATSDQKWQMPQVLNEEYPSSVGIDDDNNAFMVTSLNDQGEINVHVTYFDGKAWSAVKKISEGITDTWPKLTVSPSGKAVVTWLASTSILHSRTFVDGNWGPIRGICAFAASENYDLKMNTNGDALVIFISDGMKEIFSAFLPSNTDIWNDSQIVAPAYQGLNKISASLSQPLSPFSETGFAAWVSHQL